MKYIKEISLMTALAAMLSFTACQKKGESVEDSSADVSAEKEAAVAVDKTANLVYVNWAEGVAYTHLAKVVLEEKMGYKVNLTMADVGPAYMAVANGSSDAFMECWPAIHQDYMNEVGDNLVDLGVLYKGTALGLVVPSYVTIDKISELEANKDKFKGVITGIDSGAGMMKQTKDFIIPEYDLSFELVPSSGPAMTAALSAAIDKKEWIVVTGWRPHWMFGRWDLKLLKQDEDKTCWETGDIHIQGNVNIKKNKPELAQFLSNMYLSDAQLSDLMVQVEDSEYGVEDVAREWMLENESVVDAWVPAK